MGAILTPQKGPQSALLSCPASEIFFGGARGGGKTHGLLLDFLNYWQKWGRYTQGAIFRRSYPELEGIIDYALDMFPQFGAVYSYTKKRWTFPDGAWLILRHLDTKKDAARHQGKQYCVAVDTRVLMGDGSYKRIDSIEVGDEVMTLIGSRKVTDTVNGYMAPCVEVSVNGKSQVQPVWHPVLSSAGLTLKHTHQKRDTSRQSDENLRHPFASSGQHLYGEKENQGWVSYSEASRNYCKESHGLPEETKRPAVLSFPVVLHAPCRESKIQQNDCETLEPSLSHVVHKCAEHLSRSFAYLRSQSNHLALKASLLQSIADHLRLFPSSALSCDQSDFCIPQDSIFHCSPVYGQYDEPPPYESGTFQGSLQQQAYGAASGHVLRLDGLGTTPKRSHRLQYGVVHPYSGEVQYISEGVSFGVASMKPCGDRLVCDITVDEANHYITESGIINKNTYIGVDEIGAWADFGPLWMLKACLRNVHGLPSRMVLTGNPGGPGQAAIKERYIDDVEPYQLVPDENDPTWRRTYIPSRVSDNKILMDNDPQYIERLKQVGADWLVKAWLEGDFNAAPDTFFGGIWDDKRHIIEPIELDPEWKRFRSLDWGFASPYSVLWHAIDFNGRIITYRELYGAGKKRGEGTREDAGTVAERILDLEASERKQGIRFKGNVADTSIWMEDGRQKSINDIFLNSGVVWNKASKGAGSRINGAQECVYRLVNDDQFAVFNTCKNFIKNVPIIPSDPKNFEDVDTDAEDHDYDSWRYALMSRQPKSRKPKKRSNNTDTFDWVASKHKEPKPFDFKRLQ